MSLTVANSSGSDTLNKLVSVAPPGTLNADFTYVPGLPVLGQKISFTDTSVGTPAYWLWNFGNGVTSTTRNPLYTYPDAGVYPVSLTVASGSTTSSVTKTVTVATSEVITAASVSYADVSAAISRAKSGDTVIVPAGTATWANQLVITKGVNLVGAGDGKTVITSGYALNTSVSVLDPQQYLIVYNPASPILNESFRLSGFTLDLNNRCRGVILKNTTTSVINRVRIDHNLLKNTYRTIDPPIIAVYGSIYGIIDNNQIIGGTVRIAGLDELSWSTFAYDFGTADNLYIEDNRFTLADQMVIYSEQGSRWCFRYNSIDATACTSGLYPAFDAHGNQPNAHLANMGAEIYGNTIDTGTKGGALLGQRGGKALVYDNAWATPGAAISLVREEYHDSLNPPATNLVSGQPQHVSDSYYWNNRKNRTENIVPKIDVTIDYGGTEGVVPQENKDVWFETAVFDGTSGVGVGLLAARPTTCTKGVAYWATDTKTLYKATETNIWTAYYRPYAYPHPLRKDFNGL